ICGNSITETGETCDDGNTVTEACAYGLTSCTVCGTVCTNVAGATSYCGDNNRNVANGETCDNGALNGTPLNCNLTCSGITASICGNSITETGETCDDGNTVTEACAYGLTSCTVCGSVCTNVAGAISYCGDSNPDAANGETCDDGALNGTPLNCNLTCSGIAASVCGNSIVEGSEVCDDGNASNYGYCNFSCMARTYCGDTVIQGGVNGPNGASPALDEQCEFGNLNGATCNSLGYLSGALSCSSCTFNVSGCSNCGDGTCNGAETLATCPSDCTVCGDTIITPPEICDSNSQVCTTGSGYPGLQSCGASCSSWNTCVTALFCGDSICNGTETGVSCANDCSVCGDGVCTGLETTASCSSDCSTCGDGLITGSEACDDSGIVVGDGCGNTCSVELGFSCVGEPSICTPLCGNGFSDAGEACDDGNSVTETVADCPYGTSCIFCNDACDTVLNFTAPYCGDSTTNGPETCDFGAVQNNDPDCIYGLESCVVCVGDCSMEITGNSSYCGDGIYDPANEECDFDTGSLSIGGDGCSSSCTVETGYTCDIIDGTYKCVYSCGNGNFQPLAPYNEECDAGGENGIRCYANNYGADCQWCTGSCKLSTVVGKKCGDGSLYKSKEQCDDGGTANSDGCNYLCQKETGWKCDAYSPCKPISGDGYCIGGAYENCANNFGDCGPCSVRQIFTASRGQAFGAVGNLIKSITDMFPVPQLRIGIPGLNLNKAGIDSPPEITIGIPSGLIGAQSRTPFRINGSERFITIDNAGSDPDAPIDITFE
ncbi:MAG: hypothetical protein Q8O88_04880, partial [bacterium]|nr:hypothetical protein [bacterium]